MPLDKWFNAQLLKSLRKELEWTQEELAERAKLSVRVVAKAEAGQGVARTTLTAIVEVLQAAGKSVTINDFTRDPLVLAQKFLQNYAEFGGEFVEHSRDLLAPDIDVYMDGDPITNPLAGRYRGIEELDGIFRKFFTIFVRDGGTLGDPSQMRLIDQEVFAWGHEYIRVREAQPQLPGFVMLKMKFANGVMVRFEDYYEASGMMARIEDWAKMYPAANWIKHFDVEMLAKGKHWLPQSHMNSKYHPGNPNIFNK